MEKNAQVVLILFGFFWTSKKKIQSGIFWLKKTEKNKAKKLSFVHSNQKKNFVCTLLVKQKNIVFLLSLFQK